MIDDVLAHRRELAERQEVARRLRHAGDLALRLEVAERRGVRGEVLVVEVRHDVAVDLLARAARLLEAELDVRERLVAAADVGELVDRGEVLVGQVVEAAVGLEAEVAQRHGLVAVEVQRGQAEDQLRRQLPSAHRADHVHRDGVARAIQRLQLGRDGRERAAQVLLREARERTRIARGLERERRDLGGVGIDGERGRQVAARERIDDLRRQALRHVGAEELARDGEPARAVSVLRLADVLAVRRDQLGVDAGRQLAIRARADDEQRARLADEVTSGLGVRRRRDRGDRDQEHQSSHGRACCHRRRETNEILGAKIFLR